MGAADQSSVAGQAPGPHSGTSVVYCPEIPLGQGLLNSGLLFLLGLFRISVEIRHNFPWVLRRDGATYVIGGGLPGYQTRPTGHSNVHTARRRICYMER